MTALWPLQDEDAAEIRWKILSRSPLYSSSQPSVRTPAPTKGRLSEVPALPHGKGAATPQLGLPTSAAGLPTHASAVVTGAVDGAVQREEMEVLSALAAHVHVILKRLSGCPS